MIFTYLSEYTIQIFSKSKIFDHVRKNLPNVSDETVRIFLSKRGAIKRYLYVSRVCLVNTIGYVACYVYAEPMLERKAHSTSLRWIPPHHHSESFMPPVTQCIPDSTFGSCKAASNPFVDLSVSLLKWIILTHLVLLEHNHLNKVCIACVRVSHGRIREGSVALLELSKQGRISYQTCCA